MAIEKASREGSVKASSASGTAAIAKGPRTARETALQFMRSISNVSTPANPKAKFDRDASRDALAENATFTDPLLKLEGRDEIMRLLGVYNAANLKPKYDFKILSQKGDQVQALWITDYKFNGWDKFPVHNELKISMTVKDGKITEIRQAYDARKLAEQTVQKLAPGLPYEMAKRAMSAALRTAMHFQDE